MRKVFADAFFFLALLNKQDAWHQKALVATRAITGPILTTQWILVEVGDAFCHPSDRGLCKKLLELIAADPRFHTVGASNAQFQRWLQLYQNRADKAWSLTDCISFSRHPRSAHERSPLRAGRPKGAAASRVKAIVRAENDVLRQA